MVRDLTIDRYWDAKRYPYGPFREELNAAKRKLILVAPTLGARSGSQEISRSGRTRRDDLAKVLATIGAYAPGARGGPPPSLRNLILACHSGGGAPMRSLANGTDRALASLRECWGFDCTYNGAATTRSGPTGRARRRTPNAISTTSRARAREPPRSRNACAPCAPPTLSLNPPRHGAGTTTCRSRTGGSGSREPPSSTHSRRAASAHPRRPRPRPRQRRQSPAGRTGFRSEDAVTTRPSSPLSDRHVRRKAMATPRGSRPR